MEEGDGKEHKGKKGRERIRIGEGMEEGGGND